MRPIIQGDYFGRMSHAEPPSEEVQANAEELLKRVNALLEHAEKIGYELPEIIVNSGWRSAAYNATVPGAAVKSKHITGQAIDLRDDEGELDALFDQRRDLLEEHELWMESPASTKGWCHLQSVPPRSGNRVFFP